MKSLSKPNATPAFTASVIEGMLEKLIEDLAERVVEKLRRAEAPRLMTQRQAARYLGRSDRWLREETAAGKIECVREGKSRPRYDRESLDRYIQARNGRD